MAGDTRYSTNTAILDEFRPKRSPLVIANGKTFPDALVGAIEAIVNNCGILLIDTPNLQPVTEQYLQRRYPVEIVIMGGPFVIPEATVQRIHQLILQVMPK